MPRVPGAYTEDLSSDNTIETDSDDNDFNPPSDIVFGDGDSLDDDDDDEELDVDDDEDEEMADADVDETPARRGNGTLQLAFDVLTRRVLIIDENGEAQPLTQAHLAGSSLTLAGIRAALAARVGSGGIRAAAQRAAARTAGQDDDDEDDEEDEDYEDDDDAGSYWGPPRRHNKQYYPIPTEPVEAGVRLERSGEFGQPPKRFKDDQRKFVNYMPNLAAILRQRELNPRRSPKTTLGHMAIPNSSGVEVAQYQNRVYSGQFSDDGNFFYSATQGMRVYIYDTRRAPRVGDKSVIDDSSANPPAQPNRRARSLYGTPWDHRTSLKTTRVVKANSALCQWTITDANLSRDNSMLVYSSITPYLHLVKTGDGGSMEGGDGEQQVLDITNGRGSMSRFGVWSVRFDNAGKEIVAGANDGQIFVYDIESHRTILRVNAHHDDVNAVAFADASSSNLLLSGSDDTFVKVWDRRSLSGQRASGTLVGHTEGITFVAPKGDGRYCLSQSKDQGAKLWDLRKMVSNEDCDRLRLDSIDYSIPGWDYRSSSYAKPKYLKHPHDVSVMTYRGHAVLKTLIRCHFSPIATTDQRYVYSGSSDGKIHIWSLDGLIVQTLDRRYTHPLHSPTSGDYADPSSAQLRSTRGPSSGRYAARTVRDVAWHPFRPEMMSTAWCDGEVDGSVAKHEWVGPKGETLEDSVERQRLEAMAGYTYDSTGQYYFFVLTVLLCLLLPFTYTTLRGGAEKRAARVSYPCAGWNVKSDVIRKSKTGGAKGLLSIRHVTLALGWLAFAVVVQRASGIEGESVAFDPFKILGVSSSATQKQIKKHYRKMSLKFHPDKMVLGLNQTKEEADNVFVELTKAYKALTDEVSRHNFEMFGHPDGKQEFSQGIALPSWVVESGSKWYVMAAYALVLGVLLPVLVGRWWYGTRKLTKDGVLNSTAAKFFRALKEETTFPILLDILANADEFATDPKLLAIRRRALSNKPAVDEFARLTSTVREGPDGKLGGWEGYASWTQAQKRARVLIAAHLLRLPLKDTGLIEEQLTTVAVALPLCHGLTSIALSHNWLSSLISIMHLQQFLLQALHPTSSPLLQLPHLTEDIVARAKVTAEVENVADFGALEAGEVEKILSGFDDRRKRDVFEVAKNWPVCQVVDAKFKVVGEKVVTPGAIVSFTIKLRLTPPGQISSFAAAAPQEQVSQEDASGEGDESTIDELIGRRKAGEDGEETTPVAHAPNFPKNRKPTWSIFIGDHKLNRVFVAPHRFTDMGPNRVRTVRMSFQAPPGPGLYTFQVYCMSDAFVGTDAQRDMRMKVEPPEQGNEMQDDEDDISDPDEDTIAGQMALMKGQSVKRISDGAEDDDEEYSSGTDDSSDSSSSDSDSD